MLTERCHLCAVGRIAGFLLLFAAAWVVTGLLFRICALLFLLGWRLL